MITPEYPMFGQQGGIGVCVRTLARALADQGHFVAVLVCSDFPPCVVADGPFPVYSFGPGKLDRVFPFYLFAARFWRYGSILGKEIRRLQLDIVESPEWDGVTGLLNFFLPETVPLVVRLQTCSRIIRNCDHENKRVRSPAHKVLKLLERQLQDGMERRAVTTAHGHIAVSAAVKRGTEETMGLPPIEFDIIPNPVGDEFFQVSTPPRGSTILYVGRLEWFKGTDIFIRALPAIFQKNRDVKIVVAGPDTDTAPGGVSMRSYLLSLIPPELGSRVEFLGMVEHSRIAELLEDATVCVFPSRHEGLSIACLEAIAAGRPIVVSDIPAMRELVAGRNVGMRVHGEDPEEYAAAVNALLACERLRCAQASAGRQLAADRYSAAAISEATVKAYQKVRERNRAQPN